MSGGLAKACVPRKNYSVPEKLEFLIGNNFLLESLAACHVANSKLVMYFMVNTAFVNYLDQIDNFTEMLEVPILKNRATLEKTLPTSFNASKFDCDLLTAPKTLKDFIHQYKCRKKNLIWKKGMSIHTQI